MDDPEWIERPIREYPKFRTMYNEVYEICRNLEEVVHMYSKELQELDEGTIQYMMDEMQEQLREKDNKLREKDEKLKQQDEEPKDARLQLEEMKRRLQTLKNAQR